MSKKAKRKPPAVPKVNLLDPTIEPTDAELEALMRAMAREVRRKSAKTKRAHFDALDRAFREDADRTDSEC